MALIIRSGSAMAERLRELGDFKGMGHFEAKVEVEGLRFAPISMDRYSSLESPCSTSYSL